MAAAARRYAMQIGMTWLPCSRLRVLVARICGVRIGRGCYLGFNVFFDSNYPELIQVEDDVTISHNCTIISHAISPLQSPLAQTYRETGRIVIRRGAWLGMHVVVLPNVVVGADCLIGAGSVVTKDTDSSSVYAGNPCRKVRDLMLEAAP